MYIYIYTYIHIYIHMYCTNGAHAVFVRREKTDRNAFFGGASKKRRVQTLRAPLRVQPISVLGFCISEGLTQAES